MELISVSSEKEPPRAMGETAETGVTAGVSAKMEENGRLSVVKTEETAATRRKCCC